MNRKSITVALALCLFSTGLFSTGLLSSTAHAWQPLTPEGTTWSGAVQYFLNSQGSVDLGGFAPTETEVNRALNDWTLVSCTSLTNAYRGSTGLRAGNFEGQNTVGWTESGWPHGSQAIGVTTTRRGRRSFVEADIEMNGVNYQWQTGPGTFGNVNTYSIALHEGGHFYGLGHTNVSGSTMWPSYGGGIVGLGPDDQNGICALYAGSGSDCTMTGCPTGQECVSGSCQPIMGDGTVCSPCTSNEDCGGPADICIGYPDGGRYCGQDCASNADCGGDTCAALQGGGRQCARVVGGNFTCTAMPMGCTTSSDCPVGQQCQGGTCVAGLPGAGLGEPCDSNDACSSGLCSNGACTQTCNSNDITGSCPAGFYCNGSAASCNEGFCLAGGPGGGQLGQSCTEDTECASLFCEAGSCSQPCTPDGAATCPSGFACQTGALECLGSCQQSGALGDICDTNFECTSGICATLGDLSFCTEFCTDAMPCPDNFTCTPAGGDSSVCVPNSGGLGAECANNDDCISGICAVQGDRQYCTRICDDMTPCPAGEFACTPTADPNTSVCQPIDGGMTDGGCGCRAAGEAPGRGGLALGLLALAFVFVWRRRQ